MIRVENVSYQIGTKPILQEVDMEALPGQLIAILGPNGAGKSTLINLISGSVQPTYGQIYWRDRELSRLAGADLAIERAVLTQKVQVQGHFKVEEVVMMGRFRHFKHVPRAIDKQIVDECLAETDTLAFKGRSFHSLSGGEQQRVHFARVLAQLSHEGGPFALLLDEPLNNLDVKFQHGLLHYAKSFAQKGNLVIAVLHDLNMAAQFADQMLLLAEGKVKTFGPPGKVLQADLLAQCYDVPAYVYSHPLSGLPTVTFGEMNPILQPKISDTKWKQKPSLWPSAGKN